MASQKYFNNRNDYAESLLVHFRRAESLREEALGLASLDCNSRQICDLELLLNRAYYPLKGYNSRDDYEAVLTGMRLADGTLWPMPVCLDVPEKLAASLKPGQQLALNDPEGFLLAVMTIEDIWRPDKRAEAEAVYGTEDASAHPGVRILLEQTNDWYLSGSLEGLHLPLHFDFNELRQPPAEIHRRFYQQGWRKVIAYHTGNYMHCLQREMVMQAAREAGANIFLHPVLDPSSRENPEHYTRIRCYQQITHKFPKNMTMLGLLPLACRWAGPREALWQAIIRKNYGCSHFMVAADQGDPFAEQEDSERFYPLHDAQRLVQKFEKETGIAMVPLRNMAYVEEKAQYLAVDEIEPSMKIRQLSRQEFRRRLENDLEVPEWFTYPEIVAEMQYAFPPRSKQGFTLFFTGLSGSGKSTLAKVLFVKFMEMKGRPVTLLDGDIVRKNLSSELNFSEEHRNLNITRIGFVASEITKNGGIAICAPIAPYEESRRINRELISRCGGYIEIYVSTPLSTCEARDRKGLYAKARAGKVKGVTGVSDPYIPPSNPELTIDTTDISPTEAAQEVLLYLEEQGYIV
jgi:sulfate adenylyltransferase